MLHKRCGIEDLVRPVRLAKRRKILQSGKKASFISEGRRVVVIRMTRFPVGNDDCARAKLANLFRQAELVRSARIYVGVRNAQNAAPTESHELRRFGSLLRARFDA